MVTVKSMVKIVVRVIILLIHGLCLIQELRELVQVELVLGEQV